MADTYISKIKVDSSHEYLIYDELAHTNLDNKVDKVSGKGLSTNDYTTSEKDKLAGIAAGAQVNVQSDWDATSGDAVIKNKPTIPTVHNSTITITANNGIQGSFTGNQSSNATINIKLPTKVSDLTNDSGYLTSSTVGEAVGNATITIQKNSGTQGTFTLNQKDNKTINISVPTQISQLSDKDSYYSTIYGSYLDVNTIKGTQFVGFQNQIKGLQTSIDALIGADLETLQTIELIKAEIQNPSGPQGAQGFNTFLDTVKSALISPNTGTVVTTAPVYALDYEEPQITGEQGTLILKLVTSPQSDNNFVKKPIMTT